MSEIQCLVYSSKISLKLSLSSSNLATLAQEHQSNNGITGFYCHGNHSLFHYAEGNKAAIEALLGRLKKDKRYKNLRILNHHKRQRRLFSEWSIFITTFNQFVTAYSQAYTCIPFLPETWDKSDADNFIDMFSDYYQHYDYQNHPNYLATPANVQSLSSHQSASNNPLLKPSRRSNANRNRKYRRLGMNLFNFLPHYELSVFIKLMIILASSIVGMLIFNLSFAVSEAQGEAKKGNLNLYEVIRLPF